MIVWVECLLTPSKFIIKPAKNHTVKSWQVWISSSSKIWSVWNKSVCYLLLNFCRPCKKTTKSRDKISSNMGKPIGFTNPIVSQDEYQGWKKVVVARGDGCKQRTDPYLFTPDKTKLRYRFSFVIPIKNYIHVSCAQCLISNPASFKFSMLPFSHTKH